jgi:hypothetical protein
MLTDDREQGIKRIRLVASIISGGLFFMTAVTQFQTEPMPLGVMAFGVILSAVIGFAAMWVLMTIVKYIIKLIKR